MVRKDKSLGKSLRGKTRIFRNRASKSKTIIQKGLFSCYLAVKHVWFYLCLGRDPSEHTGAYTGDNQIQARLPSVSGKKQSFWGMIHFLKQVLKEVNNTIKKLPSQSPLGACRTDSHRFPPALAAVQCFALSASLSSGLQPGAAGLSSALQWGSVFTHPDTAGRLLQLVLYYLCLSICANNMSNILFKVSVKKTTWLLKCSSNLKAREREECQEFPSCNYEMVTLPSLELFHYQSQNSVLLKCIIDGLCDAEVECKPCTLDK